MNPGRFRLPVCEDANQKSGVVVHHVALMNAKKDMDLIAEAVKKVVDNIDDVRKLQAGEGKKYQALSR